MIPSDNNDSNAAIRVEAADNSKDNIPVETATVRCAIVPVYAAAAVLDESPNVTLTNDGIDSIVKVITSKDYLKRNIANLEYTHLSSRELRDQKYIHTVGLTIFVRPENL